MKKIFFISIILFSILNTNNLFSIDDPLANYKEASMQLGLFKTKRLRQQYLLETYQTESDRLSTKVTKISNKLKSPNLTVDETALILLETNKLSTKVLKLLAIERQLNEFLQREKK